MEQLATTEAKTQPTSHKLRIAFLASHNGTDMRAVIEAIHAGVLDAEPVLVISNNSDAPALQYIRDTSPIHFDTVHISAKSGIVEKTEEEVDALLKDTLREHDVDLVIACGYMKKVGPLTLEEFDVLNVHPALLPDMKGHWGDAIHKNAIQRRRDCPENREFAWTGVTIHRINEAYDEGEHIRQAAVKIAEDDTPDLLKNRIQELEIIMYVQVIQDIIRGHLGLPKMVRRKEGKFPENTLR